MAKDYYALDLQEPQYIGRHRPCMRLDYCARKSQRFKVVANVEKISEQHLIPILEQMLKIKTTQIRTLSFNDDAL